MPIRFYLTNAAAPAGADAIPFYVAGSASQNWEDSTGLRRALSTTKQGASAVASRAETSTSNIHDVALGQWVSPPIQRAGTLSPGDLVIVHGRQVAPESGNAFAFRRVLYVVTAAGAIRGVASNGLTSLAWTADMTAAQLAAASSTSVVCEPGDRLVVELGYRAANTAATSFTGSMRYGGTDATDLAAGDVTPAVETRSPYIEFSDATNLPLLFTPPPPDEVLGVGVDAGEARFKLQLARTGDPTITTVSLADIEAGFSESPYFFTTADGARVHMEARLDAPTTAGSTTSRAELREVDASGADFSWNPQAGEHILQGATTITGLPPVKPEVVIAQVFGLTADADVVAIRTQLVSGTIRLRVRINGVSVTSPQIASPYTVGTRFSWKIRLNNGSLEVYWALGTDALPSTPQITSAAVTETNAYFKAGLYNQSNTAAGDAGTAIGAAEHERLTVTHVAPALTNHAGAATFTGAGAMSTAGQAARQVVASFAGSGQMSTATTVARTAEASFAGAGSMTAGATRVHPAAASFAGAGSFAATPGQLGAASFAGTGQMTAATQQAHQVAASFTGSGSMLAGAQSTQRVTTAFAGVGQMSTAGTRVRPANASFAGSGSMTADGRRVHPARWTAAGAGSLFASPTRIRPGVATFAGAGRMTVQARLDKPGLNISLWAVTGSGVLAPLPTFEQLEISRERNGVGAVTVDYPAAGPGFAHLKAAVVQDRPVEVEVWFGGSRDGALRALLTQTAGDDLDGRATWRFAGTFLEAILDDAVIYPQPAPAERGELVFDAKNAGQIVATVLQQAQARGALSGVTRDWTTSADSSGQSWPNTVSGLKYSPRTTLLQVLQDLVEKDLAEFEVTRDRVLRLWAPDRRGVDRTGGAEPTLFRYGRITSSPVRHSVRETVTAVLAVGADGLSATASDASAEARIGRRIEVGVDANNVSNQGALTAYAQAALKTLTRGQEEIRHPLSFAPGDPRPKAGYDLADKVLSERAGGARRAVSVQQWTLTAARQRVTGGEVILNDLIASRLQRLARQVERIGSGAAVIGTSVAPTAPDTLAPAAPTGLVASSNIAYQVPEHTNTLAELGIGWARVTTNADGTATDDVDSYRVQYTYLGMDQVGTILDPGPGFDQGPLHWIEPTGSPTRDVNIRFGEVEADASVAVRVAAIDRSGNQSAWSAQLQLTTASDDTPPPTPSTPVLGTWFATLDVSWNGLGSAGEAMPSDTSHVEVWISRSATNTLPAAASEPVDFNPATVGAQHVANLYSAGTWNQPGITHGVGYYALLRAVDVSRNPSGQSATAGPAMAQKLVQIDIGPNAIGRQQVIDLEVVRAKIDNLAVNSAKVEEIQAGLVTTGTLIATVTLTGIIRTASTGLRWEGDPAGIRFYNSAGALTINLQGASGSALITGTVQSAMSGERWQMAPDGTLRLYPAAGTNFNAIYNEGGGGLIFRSGFDNSNRAGYLYLRSNSAQISYGTPGTLIHASRLQCSINASELWGGQIVYRADRNFGTVNRHTFTQFSGNADIPNTVLYLQDTGGSGQFPWFHSIGGNSGFIFGPNYMATSNGNGGLIELRASNVAFPSSRRLKRLERVIGWTRPGRTEPVTALDVIAGVPSKEWEYEHEAPGRRRASPGKVARRRLDDLGREIMEEVDAEWSWDERPAPKHYGPMAEDLAALAPDLVRADPNDPSMVFTDVRDLLGVTWEALRQLHDKVNDKMDKPIRGAR